MRKPNLLLQEDLWIDPDTIPERTGPTRAQLNALMAQYTASGGKVRVWTTHHNIAPGTWNGWYRAKDGSNLVRKQGVKIK